MIDLSILRSIILDGLDFGLNFGLDFGLEFLQKVLSAGRFKVCEWKAGE